MIFLADKTPRVDEAAACSAASLTCHTVGQPSPTPKNFLSDGDKCRLRSRHVLCKKTVPGTCRRGVGSHVPLDSAVARHVATVKVRSETYEDKLLPMKEIEQQTFRRLECPIQAFLKPFFISPDQPTDTWKDLKSRNPTQPSILAHIVVSYFFRFYSLDPRRALDIEPRILPSQEPSQ